MSNQRGEGRFGGFPLKICLVVIAVAALIGACVYVSIPKSSPQAPVGSTETSRPAASSTPSSTLKEDTPTKNSDQSSKAQPSKDEVWDFETAYNTTDPTLQLALLKKVATAQYIDREYSATSIDYNNLVVRVNRSLSTYSIVKDPQETYCEVITTASLESFRNGKHVASYNAPQHTTLWINTSEGWKVAFEKR